MKSFDMFLLLLLAPILHQVNLAEQLSFSLV